MGTNIHLQAFLKEIRKRAIHTGYQLETNKQRYFMSLHGEDHAYYPDIIMIGKK